MYVYHRGSESCQLSCAPVQFCFRMPPAFCSLDLSFVPASQHRLMGLIGEETAVAAASTPWSHGGVFGFGMLVE